MSQPPLITVEPVVFLCSLAYFMEQTMLQDLVFTQSCMEQSKAETLTQCESSHIENNTVRSLVIQEQSALMRNYFTISDFVPLPLCFFIGSWMDTFGCKKILLITILFYIVSQLCLIINSTFIQLKLTSLIYCSAFFDNLLGGTYGLMMIAFAHLTMITKVENRTRRSVILSSMWYAGGCCGSLLASLVQNIGKLKYQVSFMGILVLYVCILLYIAIWFNEKREAREVNSNPIFSLAHVKQSLATVIKNREPASRRSLLIIAIFAVGLFTAATVVQNNLAFPFLKQEPLKWDTKLYGYYVATALTMSGLGSLVMVPAILTLWKNQFNDSFVIVLSCCSKVAGVICLAMAKKSWLVFFSTGLFMFSDCVFPSIFSLVSKVVDEDENGKIMSLIAGTQNLFECVASYGFGSLFSTSADNPVLSFYLAAIIYLILIVSFIYVGLKKEPLAT